MVDPPTQRRRRLPSLYLGPSQVFADRDVEAVLERLQLTVETAIRSYEVPTYAITACEVGEVRGLYARDTFNRSSYRRWFSREGGTLASDPYVRLEDGGRFSCKDWGAFDPRFVLMDYADDDETAVHRLSPGLLTFAVASQRLGPISAPELSLLTRTMSRLVGLASDDAAALVSFIKSEL